MKLDITIGEVVAWLEFKYPTEYQEHYDNCGLQTGNKNTVVTGVLTTLDCTEAVIQEAFDKKCNLIITHHPVIFSGIKKLTGSNATQRIIIQAIQHKIAIYAIHTNLDNTVDQGVNWKIAEMLGLKNLKVLAPLTGKLRKIITYVPKKSTVLVREALSLAGAGVIGNYDQCSFSSDGIGTFRGNEKSHPSVGEPGQLHHENEERLEMVFPEHLQSAVIKALLQTHPYEEPAYDILKLENDWAQAGAGLTGEFEEALTPDNFLNHLKTSMQLNVIRHTQYDGNIKKVALCGGSGSFLLKQAIGSDAQAFVTSDFKYHQFFDAEGRLMIADIGHYESEKFTKNLLKDLILKKFTTFAVLLSEINTNPINYY